MSTSIQMHFFLFLNVDENFKTAQKASGPVKVEQTTGSIPEDDTERSQVHVVHDQLDIVLFPFSRSGVLQR